MLHVCAQFAKLCYFGLFIMIENNSKKVLLMTIGTGANGTDIAHGLAFSIKETNPNFLVLIGSKESLDSTFNHLISILEKEDIKIEYETKTIDEINDFEKLHFIFSDFISELINKGYKKNKISVDYTSGTKAMSAALVSAALKSEISSISYIYGDRGEGGRVKAGTERRSTLIPSKIFSEDKYKKAIEYFNSYQYEICMEFINKNEFHPDYSEKINLLKKLSVVFNNWDKFNFNIAFNKISEIDTELLKKLNLKGKFENIIKPLLFKLKEDNLSEEKILDLIKNAERRSIEKKYDDAVARLYRALEMIGQFQFEKIFHCKTNNININNEKFSSEIKDYIKTIPPSRNNEINLALFNTFKVLELFGNEIGLRFIKNNDTMNKYLSMRNNSILAHGVSPLNENNYIDFNNLINEIFSHSVNDNFTNFQFPRL